MRRPEIVAFVAVAVLSFASSASAQKIAEIAVVDNTKTSADTVILIADIEVGDTFSYELMEEVKIRLVSSELFKSVDTIATEAKGGMNMKVTIIAKDKHSWVIAPTFYNQPGNVGAGVGFAEANLFGENKKMLLYGQIATADSFFLGGFVDPSINGTRFRWGIDTFMRREKVTEYGLPAGFTDATYPLRISTINYLNGGLRLGFTLFRAFSLDMRLRGAYVFYSGAHLAEGRKCVDAIGADGDEACSDETGEVVVPGAEGWDISHETIIKLDRVANWYGIKTGNMYRLSYEHGLPSLGSDFEYRYLTLTFFRGTRGLLLGSDNFIIKGMAGIGDDMPFQQEYTSGGTSLRGYSNREFRGDRKLRMNFEYSIPMFTVASLSFRLLGFYDTAYTDFGDRETEDDFRHYLPDPGGTLGPWKNGVGGGIRVYFRSIVVPLLGWDFGYGLEAGEIQTYFAIGLTEL